MANFRTTIPKDTYDAFSRVNIPERLERIAHNMKVAKALPRRDGYENHSVLNQLATDAIEIIDFANAIKPLSRKIGEHLGAAT